MAEHHPTPARYFEETTFHGTVGPDGGIIVSAPVLERFVNVLERLERHFTNGAAALVENDEAAPGLLTVGQVAKRLGKSERDVYRLVRRGKLRKVPNLGKRTTRFRPADVDRLLAGGEEMVGRRRL